MRRKCTSRTVVKVLENLTKYVKEIEDKEYKKEFVERFDDFLDDLCSDGYFGTESQLDPRGDQRD